MSVAPITKMYHTQERWAHVLKGPIICKHEEAWFGTGYYFWYNESDAIWWGHTAKRRTGYFQVYSADIDRSNVLDTVFNEGHYLLWLKYIEQAKTKFARNGKQLTIATFNEFFKERGVYDEIDGILYQDISNNDDHWIAKKIQYKKRIQIVVYNTAIITTFALHYESECA